MLVDWWRDSKEDQHQKYFLLRRGCLCLAPHSSCWLEAPWQRSIWVILMTLNIQDENQTLSRIIKRQTKELSKIYGAESELPNLLRSQQEERRTLKIQIKKYQDVAHNLKYKLNEKDNQLMNMREANRRLKVLVESEDLEDRDSLQNQVEDLQSQLLLRDNELKELMHKLTIKEKHHKQQLSNEKSKLKTLKKEVETLHIKNDNLCDTLKKKDKQLNRLNIYSLARRVTSSLNDNEIGENNGLLQKSSSRLSGSSSLISLNLRGNDSNGRHSITELPRMDVPIVENASLNSDNHNLHVQRSILKTTSSESSLDKLDVVQEREKSFSAAKRFFESDGSQPIGFKTYDKKIATPSQKNTSINNKADIWLPKAIPKEKENHSSDHFNMRPMFTEKALDTSKKKDLLTKLEEIDSSSISSYQPSFPVLDQSISSRLSSSPSASTLNSSSGLMDRQNPRLMKELFGISGI
ncbi:unnamed protein product [Lepeophtheirus salmonis]|uniref:(salmon louse) hypothetical protein n=1 Tax=Lepeophtheirus salmonis TaxID=72036 RepID=A0A7R8CEK1_LEPSM|nr:unnamed protein product [Lepeophtheirus salmonis]CAF2796266.1 unnamed protein product [Lepeophtheirus salmonis]